MAEAKIKGRDWLLTVSTDAGVTYLPVACLTSVSMDNTKDAIDANSKCGNEMLPGDIAEQSISFEGYSITQTGSATKLSESGLYDLWKDGTQFMFKLGKVSPLPGDYVYADTGFITSLTIDSQDGELNTFSGELQIATPYATKTVTA